MTEAAKGRTPLWRQLYVQVLAAIVVGAVLGAVAPDLGKAMKPLGDAFIALIKMMISPVIFCTIVHGIGSMRDMGKVGRIGVKAIVYFEVVSTLALGMGLLAAHLLHPGLGFSSTAAASTAQTVATYVAKAHDNGVAAHLLAIIPKTFVDAFATGDLLQVLLLSILTGFAVGQLGEVGQKVTDAIDVAAHVLFKIIGILVYLAPIGAFGSMAYTVGAFGVGSLVNLAALVGTFYLTAALFVVLVLGLIARLSGFSILRFIAYIREEVLIVLGTSSSETALPGLMRKLEKLGATDSVVGLVVPTGYSFNLDGTNIYMTLSILFLAQATGTHLSVGAEATIVLISMLTSKGASGVTGAGFVTLAATLAIVPDIPIASLGMLLGVDRFMSQCRAVTNLIGNGVATLVVSRWENELDHATLATELAGGPPGVVMDEPDVQEAESP
ncbi:MAG TPA: C4-dicarboxylate transporter DctA [Caulobacteraceae bacterium]|jgi:aerobic C4-dicarboxylate transport protein|nr:C4-dicarboxylate transporter DctA [Caulobacteraceae bacterium]